MIGLATGRSAVVAFKGSHFEREIILWGVRRSNRRTVQPFLDVRVAVLDGTLEGSFRCLHLTSAPPIAPTKSLPQPEILATLHTLHHHWSMPSPGEIISF